MYKTGYVHPARGVCRWQYKFESSVTAALLLITAALELLLGNADVLGYTSAFVSCKL
jgi:hypothetical protein